MAAEQRLILLLGSPRSGTTWLAKILDTYERVLYLHEPFRKVRNASPDSALRRLIGGKPISTSERQEVLSEILANQASCVRPPFFPKSYRCCPAGALQLAWALSGLIGPATALFRALYGTAASATCDLLFKEVDWHPGLPGVDGLNPHHLIVIVRHPCAVVSSRLLGIDLGLMPDHNRDAWLALNEERALAIGYSVGMVSKMSPCEFYALDWLLENLEYQAMAARHPRARKVVFEELCRDPLGTGAELFSFLGWEMGPQTQRFINDSDKPFPEKSLLSRFFLRSSYFDLHRDTGSVANGWQTRLKREHIDEVLKVVRCFPVMESWALQSAAAR